MPPFIHDVKQLLAENSIQEAPFERIAARMRELVTDPLTSSFLTLLLLEQPLEPVVEQLVDTIVEGIRAR